MNFRSLLPSKHLSSILSSKIVVSIPNNIGTVTYETVRGSGSLVFLKKRRTLFKKKTNLVDSLTNHGKIQELCSSEAPVVRSRLR